MVSFNYSDLTKEEMLQLSSSLIKSKLISEIFREPLEEKKFSMNTIKSLIEEPKRHTYRIN
jgi:hypothetical protein